MDFVDLENKIPAYPDRVQGGASAQEILDTEKKLGIRFTAGFREFLEQFGQISVGPIEIYGVCSGIPKQLNLIEITLSERCEMRPSLRHDIVPIVNDGEGNLYCLDTAYDVDDHIPIVFWDH